MMRRMDQRAGLGDVIAATFTAWARWPSTYETLLERERSMYGTADPQEIARLIGAFCVAHLGAGIDASVFYASSQGGVSGIVLADGRRVVVKAHAPTWAPCIARSARWPPTSSRARDRSSRRRAWVGATQPSRS